MCLQAKTYVSSGFGTALGAAMGIFDLAILDLAAFQSLPPYWPPLCYAG